MRRSFNLSITNLWTTVWLTSFPFFGTDEHAESSALAVLILLSAILARV
jgi:hypothetical protein